jgi:CxxC motif-containing protein (DUF1111 family)
MRKLFVALLGAVFAACSNSDPPASVDPDAPDGLQVAPRSGGATTIEDTTKYAFSNQATNLSGETAGLFTLGHTFFQRNWVSSPATTEGMDGLGPLFNQRSCSSCHSRDGRAAPFDALGNFLNLLVRLSVPGTDAHGGPLGDPVYGGQLRPFSILDVPVSGTPTVAYEEVPGTFGDGAPFSLQRPTYTLSGWGYGEPSPDLQLSPRVGGHLVGLGLLEALEESTILALVRDDDEDGVRGHANHVWDVASASVKLGRFGWKANVPTVLQQSAGAFQGDIGITSSLFPDETCGATMTACAEAHNGGTPEIEDDKLHAVAVYMRTLAVPARRHLSDPAVRQGEALFASFRCNSCHVSELTTGDYPEIPEVAHQTIHPYTDLLVHDMGPALADGRPDFEATGTEWRTAPLWGLGLIKTVNGHEFLLHDGRARGFEEAILWHGGEALASRERYRTASAEDRAALIAFLHSL